MFKNNGFQAKKIIVLLLHLAVILPHSVLAQMQINYVARPAGKAKTLTEAEKACEALEPKKSWSLPNSELFKFTVAAAYQYPLPFTSIGSFEQAHAAVSILSWVDRKELGQGVLDDSHLLMFNFGNNTTARLNSLSQQLQGLSDSEISKKTNPTYQAYLKYVRAVLSEGINVVCFNQQPASKENDPLLQSGTKL